MDNEGYSTTVASELRPWEVGMDVKRMEAYLDQLVSEVRLKRQLGRAVEGICSAVGRLAEKAG